MRVVHGDRDRGAVSIVALLVRVVRKIGQGGLTTETKLQCGMQTFTPIDQLQMQPPAWPRSQHNCVGVHVGLFLLANGCFQHDTPA